MKNLKTLSGIAMCIALVTAGVFVFKSGTHSFPMTETPVLRDVEKKEEISSGNPSVKKTESTPAEASFAISAGAIEKEIMQLEKRKSEMDLRLSQLGFPKSITDPRITESEKLEINKLLRAKSKLRVKLFDLEIKLIEIKSGAQS